MANKWTAIQKNNMWLHRIQQENHHESGLPSQRYKATRELAPSLNPIVPQNLEEQTKEPADFPAGFFELNAPRSRPPALGNPIFGYSTHPIPAPVNLSQASPRGDSPTASGTTASAARIGQLQSELKAERKLRKQLEEQLAVAADGMRVGGKKR